MDIQQIRAWVASAKRTSLDDGAALEAWHTLSHRCRFIKTLPADAAVLDMGAGDGALQVYRTWPRPQRLDVRMFAFAITQGAQFELYEGFEIGAWPDAKPDFGGRTFDAIVAANFIEHIDSPFEFIGWIARRLTPCGSIYLEWPTPHSIRLPSASELRSFGIDVMAGNYFDDATHRHELPATEAVLAALHASGLEIEEVGSARVPYLEDHLWAIGRSEDDLVSRTLAYWSFTRWCQYVVARRVK